MNHCQINVFISIHIDAPRLPSAAVLPFSVSRTPPATILARSISGLLPSAPVASRCSLPSVERRTTRVRNVDEQSRKVIDIGATGFERMLAEVLKETSEPRASSIDAILAEAPPPTTKRPEVIPIRPGWVKRWRRRFARLFGMMWDKEDPFINFAALGVAGVSLFLCVLILKSACTDAREKVNRQGSRILVSDIER